MAAETVVAALNEEKYEATTVGRLIFSSASSTAPAVRTQACVAFCFPVIVSERFTFVWA
eukprot:COSAG02_NODE_57950_length_279_cov_0.566667_1_plen_58_part_10